MMNMIRKHISFYGWVQGVGFRYRARHAAELYGYTGWVRNEWDGSVTMEIQGTEETENNLTQLEERLVFRISFFFSPFCSFSTFKEPLSGL